MPSYRDQLMWGSTSMRGIRHAKYHPPDNFVSGSLVFSGGQMYIFEEYVSSPWIFIANDLYSWWNITWSLNTLDFTTPPICQTLHSENFAVIKESMMKMLTQAIFHKEISVKYSLQLLRFLIFFWGGGVNKLRLQVTSGNFLKQFYSETGNLKANYIYMPHMHMTCTPYLSVVMHNFLKEKSHIKYETVKKFFSWFLKNRIPLLPQSSCFANMWSTYIMADVQARHAPH